MTLIPYRWLWSRIGGRPFTFVIRDLWYKCEFLWIIGLVAIGVAIGHHYDWIMVLKVMGIFTIGYICGHLFWGKEYIENQEIDKGGD